MAPEASTSSAASTSNGTSTSTQSNGHSEPSSPTSSTSSLPSSYDPTESFQAPLSADLDKEPSIDGTSVGAGSAYGGSSSQLGEDGLRKQRLEDIDQDERAVSSSIVTRGYGVALE